MSGNKFNYFNLFVFVSTIISFFIYSPLFVNRYTSDQAIHVLMTNNFSFKTDLYYWGQNRLGSFLPALAYLFKTVFFLSPIVAVSIVQYTLVFLTCKLFCKFIVNKVLKYVFVIFWLFPLPIFKEQLFIAHPYTSQFFLFALGLYFMKLYYENNSKILSLFFSFILFGLSVWVSEFSLVLIAILLLVLFLNQFIRMFKSKHKKREILNFSLSIISLCLSFFLTYWLILYAKGVAPKDLLYEKTFSDKGQYLVGITQHFEQFKDVFINPIENGLVFSYYVVLAPVLLIIVFSSYKVFTKKTLEFNDILIIVFFISTLFGLVLLYLLEWTRYNGFNYRYWTFVYLTFFIFVFLVGSKKLFFSIKYPLAILILIQVISSSLYINDKTKMWYNEFSFKDLRLAKALGSCGIIGHYWYAYSLSSTNPEKCIAVAREGEYIRNNWQTEDLFKKDKIYLVKNDWFEVWPQTIMQYGHTLTRIGSPIYLNRLELCEYEEQKH